MYVGALSVAYFELQSTKVFSVCSWLRCLCKPLIASVSLNMAKIFDNWFSHYSWQFDCIIKSARCHFTLFFIIRFLFCFDTVLCHQAGNEVTIYIPKTGHNFWSFCFCLTSVVIIQRYCHIHLVFFFHFLSAQKIRFFYGIFLYSLHCLIPFSSYCPPSMLLCSLYF